MVSPLPPAPSSGSSSGPTYAGASCAARVFVPVKSWARAKTRLALPPDVRSRLARAFATDTLRALSASAHVAEVVVVTDNPAAAEELPAGRWRFFVDTGATGLNDALMRAVNDAAYADGRAVLAVCADLPTLRGPDVDELFALLGRSATDTRGAFVSDAHGVGTTVLATADREMFRPAFGEASRAAHSRLGWRDLSDRAAPGLRHDVDTLADLRRALLLGVGEATARAVADTELEHGLDLGTPAD